MPHITYRAPPGPPQRGRRTLVLMGILLLVACESGSDVFVPREVAEFDAMTPALSVDAPAQIPSVLATLADLRTWFLPETDPAFADRISPPVWNLERSLRVEDAEGLTAGLRTLALELSNAPTSDSDAELLVARDVVQLTARAASQLLQEPVPFFDILEAQEEISVDAPYQLKGPSL